MPNVVTSLYANNLPLREQVEACEVRQADANHVLVIVDLIVTATTKPLPERTPVQMVWGDNPSSAETFYGYVHHHQALSPKPGVANAHSVLRYVMIGTSLPMNQQRTRSWRGVSGSYVARALAKEHGLRAVVHRSPRVYPYLAQNGTSDWALLKQLATDVGFRMWVSGSTLWFVDPDVLLSTPKTINVPRFVMSGAAAGVSDSLLGLEVINGTMVEDGGVLANHTAYGYDPRSKRFFKATSGNQDAYLQQVASSAPVENLADAGALLAANSAAGKKWLTAKARVRGLARLRPGSVVVLDGSGVVPDYRGLWLVTGADHRLKAAGQSINGANNYVTELALSRDSDVAITFKDTQTVSPSVESTTCRLTDQGLWEASILEEKYVG